LENIDNQTDSDVDLINLDQYSEIFNDVLLYSTMIQASENANEIDDAVEARGKYTRCHCRQRQIKHQQQAIAWNGTAQYTKSLIVHVLTKKDINHMKQNGICFIYVSKPTCEKQKNINKIKWILDESSVESLHDICLSTTSIAICTHYHDIQDDAMLTYVGTMTSEYPKQHDCVLLALILQNQSESLDNLMDVQQLHKCCKETKHNINKANCSNHHKGVGYVYGFGSCKEFAID